MSTNLARSANRASRTSPATSAVANSATTNAISAGTWSTILRNNINEKQTKTRTIETKQKKIDTSTQQQSPKKMKVHHKCTKKD